MDCQLGAPLKAVSAVRSVKRPLNVILRWFSTSKESALRKWGIAFGPAGPDLGGLSRLDPYLLVG
jgi:hypothetical protein